MFKSYLPVKVNIPLDIYKDLNTEATKKEIPVSQLIVKYLHYMKYIDTDFINKIEAGKRTAMNMEQMRRMNMSWFEIGDRLGMHESSARRLHKKYWKG